jgi:putative ABC transport system permease protein
MYLAFAELRRGRLRFGLLAAAVALLVFLALFLATLGQTLVDFETGALATNSADVFVFDAAAHGNLRASRLAPDLVGTVASVPGVGASAGVGQADVSADAGDGPRPLVLFGVQPGQPGTPGRLVAGRWPGAGEAVVDRADTASGFTLDTVMTVRPGAARLRVVGYVSGARLGAGPTAYTTVEQWRQVLRAGNPDATSIPLNLVAVRAGPGVSAAVLAARIGAAVPGVAAVDRAAAAAAVPGVALIGQTFALLVGITFVVAVVVVGFFFLIVTVQKRRVFLALRALGASTALLARSLLVQVAVLVTIGVAVAGGVLAGAAATMPPTFPIAVDPVLVGEVLAAMLAGSLAASLLSVRRIAALDPAAGQHH